MGRVARARLLLGLLGCVSVGHAAARPSLEEARVAPAPAATARRLEATAPDQRDARAYVALWHECSPYGSHTLLALRVLAHSLRRSGTRVPFVVYVDASVSSHSRQALREDRIGVLDIPRPQGGGPNHVAGASAEDERSLCALWWRQSLWALTDYSRVVNVEVGAPSAPSRAILAPLGARCRAPAHCVHAAASPRPTTTRPRTRTRCSTAAPSACPNRSPRPSTATSWW